MNSPVNGHGVHDSMQHLRLVVALLAPKHLYISSRDIFCGYNMIKKVFIFQIEKNIFSRFLGLNFLVSALFSRKRYRRCLEKNYYISKSPALMRKFTNLAKDKYLTNTG